MSRSFRLGVVFILNALLLVALVAVGFLAHSLGVLAAAGDYLADALAIALSIASIRLARRAPNDRRSFGYERTTILAAFVNAAMVIAVAAIVAVEAIQRLIGPAHHVDGAPVIVVSAIAAGVMLAGAMILRGDSDLNVRSILLDTASDALAAAGVTIAGIVILVTGGWFWLDPAAALVIAIVIVYRAARLLKEIADVLLESTPKGLDVHKVEAAVLDGGEIADVHDLHIWGLTADAPLLSAHVVLVGHPTLEDAQAAVGRAKVRLTSRFGISHATLETECELCVNPDPHVFRQGSDSN